MPAPAEWRCDHGRGTAVVPATFPLEGCVAGGWVTLHNDTDSGVAVTARGDIGDAVGMRTDDDIADTVTRLVVGAGDVRLPHDVVRRQLGEGVAELAAAGLRPALVEPVAATLRGVLPPGADRADLQPYAGLVRDVAEAVEARTDCLPDRNFLGQAACDVRTAVRIARAVTESPTADATSDVFPLVLDPSRWTEWAAARGPDVPAVLRFDGWVVRSVQVLPVERPDHRDAEPRPGDAAAVAIPAPRPAAPSSPGAAPPPPPAGPAPGGPAPEPPACPGSGNPGGPPGLPNDPGPGGGGRPEDPGDGKGNGKGGGKGDTEDDDEKGKGAKGGGRKDRDDDDGKDG